MLAFPSNRHRVKALLAHGVRAGGIPLRAPPGTIDRLAVDPVDLAPQAIHGRRLIAADRPGDRRPVSGADQRAPLTALLDLEPAALVRLGEHASALPQLTGDGPAAQLALRRAPAVDARRAGPAQLVQLPSAPGACSLAHVPLPATA